MASVRSSGVSPGAASQTCVVTKPAGLALGDLMIAPIVFDDDAAGINDPGGWSLQPNYPQVITGTFKTQLNLYQKYADANDVAASTFTWTSDISTSNIGCIIAIKDADPIDWLAGQSVRVNAASFTVTADSIIPLAMNCLLLLIGCVGDNLTGSGYAIATNNPGAWTEEVDINTIAGQDCCVQVASALRPHASPTGSGTYTVSLGGAGNIGAMIAIKGISKGVQPNKLRPRLFRP